MIIDGSNKSSSPTHTNGGGGNVDMNYKVKRFSGILGVPKNLQKNNSDPNEKKDTKFMRNSGKVLLTGAGAIGAATAYHAGQAVRHASKGIKDIGEIRKSLRGNANLKGVLTDSVNRYVPVGGDIINKGINIVSSNKDKLRGSQVGKIEMGTKILNRASRLPRFVVNNAHLVAENAINEAKNRGRDSLSKSELKALDKIPSAIKHLGRGVNYMKNAKFLGKGAAALGATGGFMYINGRMIQSSDKGARNK